MTSRAVKAVRKAVRYFRPARFDAGTDSDYPWTGISYDPNGVPDETYQRFYPSESLQSRRFYNIGAGSFRHRYWTNVDFASDWYEAQQKDSDFINFDLLSLGRLPIEDGLAEVVYTSHTVEHVSDPAAQNMFNEAHRILKPGGIFRLTTPNIALDLAAWRRNDRDYFYYLDLYSHPKVCERIGTRPFKDASLEQIILFVFASHISELVIDSDLPRVSDQEFRDAFARLGDEGALTYFAQKCTIEAQRKRPGFHMNWWTESKALRMLREAGFETVFRSGFGQSHSPAMRDILLFDKQDPKLSLYVEAIR